MPLFLQSLTVLTKLEKKIFSFLSKLFFRPTIDHSLVKGLKKETGDLGAEEISRFKFLT